MTLMSSILNELYFIKKITFHSESNKLVELITVTKEVTELRENKSIVSPEILASCIKETSESGLDTSFTEVKVNITKEQAELLSGLVSNEEEFLSSINQII